MRSGVSGAIRKVFGVTGSLGRWPGRRREASGHRDLHRILGFPESGRRSSDLRLEREGEGDEREREQGTEMKKKYKFFFCFYIVLMRRRFGHSKTRRIRAFSIGSTRSGRNRSRSLTGRTRRTCLRCTDVIHDVSKRPELNSTRTCPSTR